eukprot:TRINITY_DN1555_c0_g1_i1.p1 TRINITY_DN1555_c0_g1~~TRINITY_DN1555_c0_g1_i1.p1  ORF type:complete len:300 (+),score=-35.39 TRINITY_DN1555_c0_g1_i1:436-1335(+)
MFTDNFNYSDNVLNIEHLLKQNPTNGAILQEFIIIFQNFIQKKGYHQRRAVDSQIKFIFIYNKIMQTKTVRKLDETIKFIIIFISNIFQQISKCITKNLSYKTDQYQQCDNIAEIYSQQIYYYQFKCIHITQNLFMQWQQKRKQIINMLAFSCRNKWDTYTNFQKYNTLYLQEQRRIYNNININYILILEIFLQIPQEGFEIFLQVQKIFTINQNQTMYVYSVSNKTIIIQNNSEFKLRKQSFIAYKYIVVGEIYNNSKILKYALSIQAIKYTKIPNISTADIILGYTYYIFHHICTQM